MEVVTGAMGSLLPKLGELIVGEYNLQKGVKKDVQSLEREMKRMHAALSKVAEVPRDQLDPQVKIWADELRELSYDMEDVIDNFMVCIEGSDATNYYSHKLTEVLQKMVNLFTKGKARHQIADAIKEVKNRAKEVAYQRLIYKVDDIVANAASRNNFDPRLLSLYKDQKELVGIEGAHGELTKKLTDCDGDVSKEQLKIVSICGIGGLGKTTLAKALYNRLPVQFDYKAFVPVGRNPEVKKVLKDILLELGKTRPMAMDDIATLDEKQLIEKLQGLLEYARYFIVIDDIWDIESWKIIKCALLDNGRGSRIITTTRILDVATKTGDVYRLEPLSHDFSEELFYTRLFGGKGKCPYDQPTELSNKILDKCGGVPLAIITISSLLVDKPMEEWSKVYKSIGFAYGDNTNVVENTRKIILFSYYDLPIYLRSCLLHFIIFPEDCLIKKDLLIWKWVAEGFIGGEQGVGLFETGERYFSELVNKSMIQPVEEPDSCIIYACRIHDMVLDMIYLLSKEQNFVSILDSHEQRTSPQTHDRRVSVYKRTMEKGDPLANTSLPKLRSFYATTCHMMIMPSLSRFKVLRVLAMENCTIKGDFHYHIKHLGTLLQLRYFGLEGTPISMLPEEIANLRFLQILDLRGTEIEDLPHSVGLLRNLKRLRADEGCYTRVPNWIGNLTSLEELYLVLSHGESSIFMKELGKLTELRVLCIFVEGVSEHSKQTLVKSLGNLQRIQVLRLSGNDWSSWEAHSYWNGYVPPQQLRDLKIPGSFRRLPWWINSLSVPNLSKLHISLCPLEEEDIVTLGSLPELLTLSQAIPAGMEHTDGAFPKLRNCKVYGPFRFSRGSMQRLETISFRVNMQDLKDGSKDLDFRSLGNLRSLRKVKARIGCRGARATDVKVLEAALRQAIDDHLNRPFLDLGTVDDHLMMKEKEVASRPHRTNASAGTSAQPAKEREAEDRSTEVAAREGLPSVGTPARRTWRQWAFSACLHCGTSSSAPPPPATSANVVIQGMDQVEDEKGTAQR